MSEHGRPVSGRSAAHASLISLREAVLQLHKALVDSERVEYERAFGPVGSATDFLRLLATDPWFAWLSPLTRLLVSMDEAIEGEEPMTAQQVNGMTTETFGLLVTDEGGEGFGRHYFNALQRDPDVVMAHAAVAKLRPKQAR